MEWPDLLAEIRWEQGEHVSIVGPTGYGKTTIEKALIKLRSAVVVIGTKPRAPHGDPNLAGLIKSDGFVRIKTWPPPRPPYMMPKVLLWPDWKGSADTAANAELFREAFADIFAVGKWCVCADELAFLVRRFGLKTELEDMWGQGRSLKISLLGCTQRPAWVPLEMYSMATHLFLFACNDDRDLARIQGIGGVDPATIRRIVRRLRKYEFLYVNTATKRLVLSRTPAP